ncbi:flagellar protein FlaG [Ferrimonas senticii]|uniref:flagellar protein FlaG n=1 Tax=Ferrimonas senticii TaxID=394566 RepID=UPI000411355D|nr:flagellar protein FlaG [Ferrimonas senticii]
MTANINSVSAAITPLVGAAATPDNNHLHNNQQVSPTAEPQGSNIGGKKLPPQQAIAATALEAMTQQPQVEGEVSLGQGNQQTLQKMAQELARFMDANQRALAFEVDDSSGQSVVVVRERQTDEVIRQIPSEEMLKLAAKLSDLRGLLVDLEI